MSMQAKRMRGRTPTPGRYHGLRERQGNYTRIPYAFINAPSSFITVFKEHQVLGCILSVFLFSFCDQELYGWS